MRLKGNQYSLHCIFAIRLFEGTQVNVGNIMLKYRVAERNRRHFILLIRHIYIIFNTREDEWFSFIRCLIDLGFQRGRRGSNQ